MRLFQISFVWVIAFCGVLSLVAIFWNLGYYGLRRFPGEPRRHLEGGDPALGKLALKRYGCGGCHVIPGLRSATGRVGPSLRDIEHQTYIAGVLANTPENMMRWIMDPKRYSPETAMPDLDVGESDARDMVSYLYDPAILAWGHKP